MMNKFGKFSRFPVVFVIKRQIYIEFKVFWKEKKEELEVQKTIMGYSPFSGLCRDREISVVIENTNPVS